MNDITNPILVEYVRGEMTESFHRGAAAVVHCNGDVVESFGDIERLIYPRSAIKPLQSFLLVESGALERFGLGSEHIALACASHSGQPQHVDTISKWFQTIAVKESSLECGPQQSSHRATRDDMIRRGITAGAIYNNCSGKHAGFITVARHCGNPIEGYIRRSHPVQRRALQTLEELTEEPITSRPSALDGCGIPVVGMSLRAIAGAFARLAGERFDSSARCNSARRIRNAMMRHPELVGGEKRFCTAVAEVTGAKVLVKVGAEGVYAGMTTGTEPVLGFALKIDDGSRRAAEVAMGGLICRNFSMTPQMLNSLQPWFVPQVLTVAKKSAGTIRPCFI